MRSETRELAVVVPVYGVGEGVRDVISRWDRMLTALGPDYEIHVYDDGSTDQTGTILDELVTLYPRLRVHHQTNRGHGPTILRGYRENAEAAWIFQFDSDDEIGPEFFPELWREREGFDFLCGRRVGREIPGYRRFISRMGEWVTSLLFGKGLADVNVPYRLMRMSRFRPFLGLLPDDTLSPNSLLAGAARFAGLRLHQRPLPEKPRQREERPRKTWGWVKISILSVLQTAGFRLRLGAAARRGAWA